MTLSRNLPSLLTLPALLLLGLPSAATAQCKSSCGPTQDDIVETALAAGSFETLAAALEHTGLVEALKGDGPFTVFAPTDAAFAKLPPGTLERLLLPENRATLTSILKHHVVAGRLEATQVVRSSFLTTLQGQRVAIRSGDGVRIDQARVTRAGIDCRNGVIHVIDRVILPASASLLTTAVEAGSFKTLVAAIEAAGLASALEGPGPFTVFAPTDEAFAKLPAGTVASLLRPQNRAKLTRILKLHVVPGRLYSDQALGAGQVSTLEGSRVKLSLERGVARVGEGELIRPDVEAANGVIHVIDSVLLPEEGEVSARPTPPGKSWF